MIDTKIEVKSCIVITILVGNGETEISLNVFKAKQVTEHLRNIEDFMGSGMSWHEILHKIIKHEDKKLYDKLPLDIDDALLDQIVQEIKDYVQNILMEQGNENLCSYREGLQAMLLHRKEIEAFSKALLIKNKAERLKYLEVLQEDKE